MNSLKAFAQSTLGELKDALVDAVGDDDDDDEDFPGPQTLQADTERPVLSDGGRDLPDSHGALATNGATAKVPDTAESEAVIEFQTVQGSPFLESLLSQLDSEKVKRAKEWDKGGLSIPEIASLACWTLRQLLPLTVPASHSTKEAQSETQRLLTSFSERHETLSMEHAALQQKARELSLANADLARSAQQAESWKSAHGTAIARLEELSSENAELKERLRSTKRATMEADQDQQSRNQLAQKLVQKDAEIRALGEALERLQEVVDDQSSLATKCWNLERELRELEELKAQQLQATTRQEASEVQKTRAQNTSQISQESHGLLARCQHAEKELSETSAALELLLEEKSKRLEDQEHLVDRRLVTSMLALYHDHVSSGQRALADQVLTQALHILGGVPEETQRSRRQVKEAAAAAEARLAEPLGNAFLDFLEKEMKETDVEMAGATHVVKPGPTAVTGTGENLLVPNSSASLTSASLPPVAPPQVPLPPG